MDAKESFFSQFPKGCPSCGGPKRYMAFNALVKRPKGVLNIHPIGAMIGLAAGGFSYFAECQACHEAYVWQEDAKRWINANQVRKGTKRKATTQKDGRADRDDRSSIGKIY